jgi:hypothetical protein
LHNIFSGSNVAIRSDYVPVGRLITPKAQALTLSEGNFWTASLESDFGRAPLISDVFPNPDGRRRCGLRRSEGLRLWLDLRVSRNRELRLSRGLGRIVRARLADRPIDRTTKRAEPLAYQRYRQNPAELERSTLFSRSSLNPGCADAQGRVKCLIRDHANGFAFQHHFEFGALYPARRGASSSSLAAR